MKIGSVVIRCYEFDEMLAFWREALHYAPREPAGRGPNVSLDQVSEPFGRIGKTSRLHLDLYTTEQEDEVERLG